MEQGVSCSGDRVDFEGGPLCAFLLLVALGPGMWNAWASAEDNHQLKPAELQSALDDFKRALDERWSYRRANGADFDAAIAALRRRVEAGLSVDELGLELHKILALGIDGHSLVSGYRLPGGGHLPFLLEPDGERFVAFNPERTAFLADGLPYLIEIDGKDVAEWCRAAAALVPKGSPQYIRRHCLSRLRDLDYVRGAMELPRKDTVEVELASRDGKTRRTLTLRVAAAPPDYGTWPRGGSRLLEGNVGYLRLANMAKSTSVEERRAISEFAATFKPEWELPPGQFSPWHYMRLRRLDDPDIYHYEKPVVVLMNAKCFSATDIFLAGPKGMKNVTLLGTPSGGGSAFTQDVTLGATPLRLRIGSMVSFQADGRLFDGHGVRPDILAEPTPEYHIGGQDNVLAEAMRLVMEGTPSGTSTIGGTTYALAQPLPSTTARARWPRR